MSAALKKKTVTFAAAAAAAAAAPEIDAEATQPQAPRAAVAALYDSDSDNDANPHRLAEFMNLELLIAECRRDGCADPVKAAQTYLSDWQRKCVLWDQRHAAKASPVRAAAAAAAAALPPIAEPESPTPLSPSEDRMSSHASDDDDCDSTSDVEAESEAGRAAIKAVRKFEAALAHADAVPAPASASSSAPVKSSRRLIPHRDVAEITSAEPTAFELAADEEPVRPALPTPDVSASPASAASKKTPAAAADVAASAMEDDEDEDEEDDDNVDDDIVDQNLGLDLEFEEFSTGLSRDAKAALATIQSFAARESCKRVANSQAIKNATAELDARRRHERRGHMLDVLDVSFVDMRTRVGTRLTESGFIHVAAREGLSTLVLDYLFGPVKASTVEDSKRDHKIKALRATTDALHKLLTVGEHSSLVHVTTAINDCATTADGLAVKQAMSFVRDVFYERGTPSLTLDKHELLDLLTQFSSEVVQLSLTAFSRGMTFLVNEDDLRRQVMAKDEFLQLVRATPVSAAAAAVGDDERFVDAVRRVNLSKSSSKLNKFASLIEHVKPIMERMLAKAKRAAVIAAGVPDPHETQEELESVLGSYFDRQLALGASKMGCLAAYMGLQAQERHNFRFTYGASDIAVDSKKSSAKAPTSIAVSGGFLKTLAFTGEEKAGVDEVAETVSSSSRSKPKAAGAKRKSPSPTTPAPAPAAASTSVSAAVAAGVVRLPRGKPPTSISDSETETDEDLPQEPVAKKAKSDTWKTKLAVLCSIYDTVAGSAKKQVKFPLESTCVMCNDPAEKVTGGCLYTCSACLSATVCRMCAACHWGYRDCNIIAKCDNPKFNTLVSEPDIRKVVELRKLWFQQTHPDLVLDSPPITALKNKAKAAKRAAIKRAAVKQAVAAAPTPVAAAAASPSPSPTLSSSPAAAAAAAAASPMHDDDECRQICKECRSVYEDWEHDCEGDGCSDCGKCKGCCETCKTEDCFRESGCFTCGNPDLCGKCCCNVEAD